MNAIESRSLATRAAIASVATAIVLGLVKGWAAWATGSVSMLGSLADTVLDLVGSLVTLWGVRLAMTPADSDHRFGHGKAEALAALVQVAMITVSAVGIVWSAARALLGAPEVAAPIEGIVVSAFAIVMTAALIAYQKHVVKRTGSIAIGADSVHYQSDLVVNVAVVAALGLAALGVRHADPVAGMAIAIWLVLNAARASTTAIDQLMDREWGEEKRADFLDVASRIPELKGMHDLRTRSSGNRDFAQFHMFLPPLMTMVEAHDVMDTVEAKLHRAFPTMEVLIHLDPEGHVDMAGVLPAHIAERPEI